MRDAPVAARSARPRQDAAGTPDRRPATASVIVTTCNEGDRLQATVDALLETLPETAQLVVVDDGSTDGSTDPLVSLAAPVRLLRTPRRLGITGARNLGAAAATGDVLVFSDAHVDPRPGWLEALLDALRPATVGMVAPVVTDLERHQDKGYGFSWEDPSMTMRWLAADGAADPYPVPFLCGCFLAVRRRVFEEVGGFDEGLRGWGSEDAELCLRLWSLGLECRVVPDAEIAHLFRPAFPYEVDWASTMHNRLRLSTVHLGQRALEVVVAHHAGFPAFGESWARLMVSDVWAQRDHVRAIRRFDGDWFIDRFGIDALR